MFLGCRFDPWLWLDASRRQPINVFFSYQCFSLSIAPLPIFPPFLSEDEQKQTQKQKNTFKVYSLVNFDKRVVLISVPPSIRDTEHSYHPIQARHVSLQPILPPPAPAKHQSDFRH